MGGPASPARQLLPLSQQLTTGSTDTAGGGGAKRWAAPPALLGVRGPKGRAYPPRDLGLPVTVLPGKGAPCGRGTPLPGAASLLRVPVVHFLNSKLGVRLCGRS